MLKLLHYDRADERAQLEALIGRLRDASAGDDEVDRRVGTIVDEVRGGGDEAVLKYVRQFTLPEATRADLRVDPARFREAYDALSGELRGALERAVSHVRAYQQHIMPLDPPPANIDGAEVGLRFMPMQRVGLTVPGGKANYPSTLIMLAVPARVAGVKELAVCCPPPTRKPGEAVSPQSDVSPLVLAVAHILRIDEVYRVGGAEAIAAMAYGTDTIKPVDFIAGPGVYSQYAKRRVFGTVGIDGLLGPSEVVVLMDGTARADWIASDLIAQAEHDPGCCFLVAWEKKVLDDVLAEVQAQLPKRKRRAAAEQALTDWSAAVLAPDEHVALEVVDRIASEHVTLAVRDPQGALKKLHHGGAWFLGHQTPVASGDYYAGPSHCLPTGTTARFTSGVSVYTFLKRSSVECYPRGLPAQAIEDIARLAEAEGLDGHAQSARVRGA